MPPVCPSSEVRGGTPGNTLEWVGTTNPSKSKAMAGNCASCLRFPIALPAGSNPAFGTSSGPAISTGCWVFLCPHFLHVTSVCPSGVSSPKRRAAGGLGRSSSCTALSRALGDRCAYILASSPAWGRLASWTANGSVRR
ncbi:MAG: hypothetical protein EOO70_02165 [Myxococcaceae bacterium]|nr:MAG: hypothetical protein EOO70_02165 [Myxococcaceae bacterium]